MSASSSTAIEQVTENRIKNHYLDKTHYHQNQDHNSLVSSASEQNGCRRNWKTWGCQPCVEPTTHKPQFNVAANGHDYLGESCSEENNNIEDDTSLLCRNMVPHGENMVIEGNEKSLDRESDIKAKENVSSNSSGLVLKKDNKSWTVKLKTSCSSSAESFNASCLNIRDGNGESSTEIRENTNCSRDQLPPNKYCIIDSTGQTVSSDILTEPSCPTPDNGSNYNCEHVANTGTLCKIRIKHVHRNGPLIQMSPHDTSQDVAKVKKKKKKDKTHKHSPSVYGTSACRKSAEANGEHQKAYRRNFLAEGREGEEAAVKALTVANGLPRSNESVKNAEREIARALEIIQLQIQVLQTEKKRKLTKSGKVVKEGCKLMPKKKCNSWEPNHTIDFADVFSLPPSLTVRDGDLFPACSMRTDPFCPPGPNHPIWRWRLGKKPLPRPSKRRLSNVSLENSSEGTSLR